MIEIRQGSHVLGLDVGALDVFDASVADVAALRVATRKAPDGFWQLEGPLGRTLAFALKTVALELVAGGDVNLGYGIRAREVRDTSSPDWDAGRAERRSMADY